MTTSEAWARATIGNSAAEAAPPSKTFRRVIVMRWSFVAGAIDETISIQRKASKNSKMLILEVGDEHQSRRVGDGERYFRRRDHRLWRHAARPEHRDLVGLDRHRVTIVRFGDIGDADRSGKTEMDRRAVH